MLFSTKIRLLQILKGTVFVFSNLSWLAGMAFVAMTSNTGWKPFLLIALPSLVVAFCGFMFTSKLASFIEDKEVAHQMRS